MTTTTLKQNKVPQQILPKPATGTTSTTAVAQNIIQQTTTTKTVVTQSKVPTVPVQPQQLHPQSMAQFMPSNAAHVMNATAQSAQQAATAAQGGSILLPTGQPLNAQPLLLNQMPVLVQQNTSQGVQLILRPQTPQLAAPSLVIHNTRPQLQQQQPQQLLRILNTNGAMQLAAAAPTFIVSSQANLIQQNLQSIKTTNGSPTIMGNLQGRQPQQLAAAINSQLLGQSMAHLQNLQLNGNLTQIQMPNGLNGQFISQLPSQFQQSLAGFNQGINLNQLTNQNFSQIAQAAANQSFQSPPPQELIPTVVQAQNIQFNAQPSSGNVTPIACTTPQPHIISSPTPQLISSSNTSDSPPQGIVLGTVTPTMVQPTLQQQPILYQSTPKVLSGHNDDKDNFTPATHKLVKKPKKTRIKKSTTAPPVVSVAPTVVVSPPQSPPQQPTGKLDLANVMKLCGIMEDDYMDTEMDDHEPQTGAQPQTASQVGQPTEPVTSSPMTDSSGQVIGQLATSGSNYMITIPSSDQNSNIPITFSIPANLTDPGQVLSQLHGMSSVDGKDQPFMITIDPSVTGESQPYTIALPKPPNQMSLVSDNQHQQTVESTKETNVVSVPTTKQQATVAPTVITSVPPSITSPSTMCVPTFVNSVLNTTVTPTLQSQINEIQNQLMAAATPVTNATITTPPMFSPKSKKRNVGRKSSLKKEDKCDEIPAASVAPMINTSISNNLNLNSGGLVTSTSTPVSSSSSCSSVPPTIPNVPTQIGNIHISQVDGASVKNNHINNKSINNQIQIMPILASSTDTTKPTMTNIASIPSITTSTNTLTTQMVSTPIMSETKPVAAVVSTPLNSTPSQVIQTVPNIVSNVIQNGSNVSMSQLIQPIPQPITSSGLMPTALSANIMAAQNPGVQNLLSQLTGHLSLSLAEDRRLLLKHDINQPQDAQSQMILQTILTGALGNVTLVNEPSKPSNSPPTSQAGNTIKQQPSLVTAPVQTTGAVTMPGQMITSPGPISGGLMQQQNLFSMNFQQVSKRRLSYPTVWLSTD